MATPVPAFRVSRAVQFVVLALALTAGGVSVQAAQFDVTNADDSGPGSLRAALAAAALAPGDDEVVVQPSLGTITLSSPLSWIGIPGPNAVTIRGNGVRLDFGGTAPGLADDGGDGVTVEDVEITGVASDPGNDNAAVLSQGGAMRLVRCRIFGNDLVSDDGDVGAVLSEGGALTLEDCEIFDNDLSSQNGDVAAVLSEGGPLTLVDCEVRGNVASAVDDVCGGVLSEGGALVVTRCVVERNQGSSDGRAGGGLHSEGGDVTVDDSTISCNTGSSVSDDAAGGILDEGGDLTITGSVIAGNRATGDGEQDVADSIVSFDETPDISNTTIDDSNSACVAAVESYFLPKNVNAQFDGADPSKSSLITAGFFDTGSGVVDLTQPATLLVGGLTFAVPGLVAKGKAFTHTAAGISLVITPNKTGSSRAKFKLKATGDLTGKVDPQGPLTLRFTQGAVDAVGTVRLTSGRYTIGKVRGALVEPNVYLQRCKASLKGGGNDALTVLVGLATNGTTPAAASDVTLGFAAAAPVTIPGGSFVKKGDQFKFAGDVGGITKVTLDFARERITIGGRGLDLGAFAQGGNSVQVAVSLGADARAVRVRMARKGASMKY